MKNILSMLFFLSISHAALAKEKAKVTVKEKTQQALPSSPQALKKINFNSAAGKINFTAIGRPAMIKILGTGPGPQGEITYDQATISGTFTFQLSQLNTGIELRDDHMKNKYLEIETYPKATLEIKDQALSKSVDAIDSTELSQTIKGLMTVHGKTNPIDIKLKINKVKNSFVVKADFTLKIMDYLSTLPSYMGLKVAEDIQVSVETTAN
jgi:polyisoprenoid-binding protein YceI